MDNKIIEQLREEAKDALIHWAELYKVDNEMAEIISETKKGSNLRR